MCVCMCLFFNARVVLFSCAILSDKIASVLQVLNNTIKYMGMVMLIIFNPIQF